jgi:hypothetical protein
VGNSAGLNLTTGSNNVDIANKGVAADADKIRIGTQGTQTAAYLAGVYGITPSGTTQTVVINSSGQLGSTTTPASESADVAQSVPQRSATRALGVRLGKTSAQVHRLERQLGQFNARNATLAAELGRFNARNATLAAELNARNATLAAELGQLRALILKHPRTPAAVSPTG